MIGRLGVALSIERFSREHAAPHRETDSLARYRLGDSRRIADKNNGVGKRTSLGKIDGIGGAKPMDFLARFEKPDLRYGFALNARSAKLSTPTRGRMRLSMASPRLAVPSPTPTRPA